MENNFDVEFKKFCVEHNYNLSSEFIDLIVNAMASTYLMEKVHSDYWDMKFQALENKQKYDSIESLLYILWALKQYAGLEIKVDENTLIGTIFINGNRPIYVVLHRQQIELLKELKIIK